MPLETKTPTADASTTGYAVDDRVQGKFLQNPNFCLCLQEYLQNLLSISIAIIPRRLLKNHPDTKKSSSGYMIHLLGEYEQKTETEQVLSDCVKHLFETMQSHTFTDSKVNEWLRYPSTKVNNLKCLQKIMDEKVHYVFTVCEVSEKDSLKIYYLSKTLDDVSNSKELEKIIESKISQETILLPLQYKRSAKVENAVKKITANREVSTSIVPVDLNSKIMERKIILFGYYKVVNQLKGDLLNTIEKYQMITFKLNSLDASQIEFLLSTCSRKLRAIEKKYKQFGVELRIGSSEFSAPEHLKNEIEARIRELLVHSSTATFKSIQLFKDVGELAEKHLKSIAYANHCQIMTELRQKSPYYIIPKALPSHIQVSKSVVKQSDHFLSSSDVFTRITVANGSTEIRTGDIALQQVDAIVMSATSNGLKEGVIERAGAFEYEKTYSDATGIKLTETNGGNLPCKWILFSDWMPRTITDDDNALRNLVKIFVSYSIKCAIKDRNLKSIAFAVSDLCTNETILAQEMIAAVKQQLESKNLQLKVSFILLPEQQTLHNQFFTLLAEMQDIYAQVNWSTIVIKITLKAFDNENLTKCQEKINRYLKRCITSTKLTDSVGVFQHWDQHTINAFHKYCQDKCVLPQIDPTKKELELTGPVNNVLEVKQKWQYLFDLIQEKVSHVSNMERPSSAALRSVRLETGTSMGQTKVYNIMISYCQQDVRKCQCLINRLIEEGFSIWAEPIIAEQQRNVFSQIDKSDCILLCISEDYYESQVCQEEARYALQTGKQVFLVKIQNDPLVGWQRRVFEGKLLFQLFGSENHFDLEFGKLLLEILRYTRSGFVPLLQQISGRLQLDNVESQRLLTAEQRRSMYDKRVKILIKIGHIEEEEMKTLIAQLQTVISSMKEEQIASNRQNKTTSNNDRTNQNTTKESNWLERWLRKSTNVTKQNIPPFSASGDINDAVFPMPEYLVETLNLHVLSFPTTPNPSIKFGNVFEYGIIKRPVELPFTRILFSSVPADDERVYGKCTTKLEVFDGLSRVFFNRQLTIDAAPQKAMNLPVLSPEVLSLSENQVQKHPISKDKRQTKGEREKDPRNFIKKYKNPTREELDVYLKKFAEQMNESAKKFEEFCSKAALTA